MDELKFCPLQEGYSFAVGKLVTEQELERGMPREMIKFVGAVHQVSAQIFLKDQLERQLFWAFYRLNQTKLWRWRLDLDGGQIEDCICQFDNTTVPSNAFIAGVVRKIQLNVRVVPIERDPKFDEWLVKQWQDGKIKDISDFEKIPNVWMPKATGVT